MRFFEDGDLTVGLKVAPRSHPIEDIQGEWHITWAHVDGNQRTTNYDEPNALLAMGLTVRAIEPTDKRKKMPNDNIAVELKFCQWGLEYRGHYNENGPATKLSLVLNSTPDRVDADDDAYLVFGAVRDDEDYPFMSLMTAVLPHEARLKHYQNMEFVAKKTDEIGIHPLELTRNERLRLGFKMNDDGVFTDFASPVSSNDIQSYLKKDRKAGDVTISYGETYTKLMKELKAHTEARDEIKSQLRLLKKQMDSEYRDLNLSPSPSPNSRKRTTLPVRTSTAESSRHTGPVKRTASGTAKKPGRNSTGGAFPVQRRQRRRKQTARARESLDKTRRATVNGPVNGNEELSDEGAESDEEASSEEGEVGSRFSATALDATAGASSGDEDQRANGRGKSTRNQSPARMRLCNVCKKSVTSKNWGVHIKTGIHKNNIADARRIGLAIDGEEMEIMSRRKSIRRVVNGDSDAVPAPLSPSGNSKLKRPSSNVLRGAAAGAGRGRASHSPA